MNSHLNSDGLFEFTNLFVLGLYCMLQVFSTAFETCCFDNDRKSPQGKSPVLRYRIKPDTPFTPHVLSESPFFFLQHCVVLLPFLCFFL